MMAGRRPACARPAPAGNSTQYTSPTLIRQVLHTRIAATRPGSGPATQPIRVSIRRSSAHLSVEPIESRSVSRPGESVFLALSDTFHVDRLEVQYSHPLRPKYLP